MTDRRNVLLFTAKAVAAGAVLPVGKARAEGTGRVWPISLFPPGHHPRLDPTPDAALLAACEAFQAVNVEWMRLDTTEDELTAAGKRWHELLDQIADTRPGTLAGLKAKAGVVRTAFVGDVATGIGSAVEDQAEPHEYAAWKLLHDVLAMEGVA